MGSPCTKSRAPLLVETLRRRWCCAAQLAVLRRLAKIASLVASRPVNRGKRTRLLPTDRWNRLISTLGSRTRNMGEGEKGRQKGAPTKEVMGCLLMLPRRGFER